MLSQSKKVLLYDCRNKKSTVVLSMKGGNWSTCWSEDSKYFIIFDIEAQSNRLHIYKSSNVLEEDLPKDLLDISSKIDWVAWIDRENILIDGKGDPSESYLFNIKNKKLEIMSDDTKSYYYSKIYERQKQTTELLSISPYPDIGEIFLKVNTLKIRKNFYITQINMKHIYLTLRQKQKNIYLTDLDYNDRQMRLK